MQEVPLQCNLCLFTFSGVPNLILFTLMFTQVKKCGIDFRWNMFGMTVRDADNLAMGLRICRKLRKIKIYNSKIDDDKFYAVYDGMKNLPGVGNKPL